MRYDTILFKQTKFGVGKAKIKMEKPKAKVDIKTKFNVEPTGF